MAGGGCHKAGAMAGMDFYPRATGGWTYRQADVFDRSLSTSARSAFLTLLVADGPAAARVSPPLPPGAGSRRRRRFTTRRHLPRRQPRHRSAGERHPLAPRPRPPLGRLERSRGAPRSLPAALEACARVACAGRLLRGSRPRCVAFFRAAIAAAGRSSHPQPQAWRAGRVRRWDGHRDLTAPDTTGWSSSQS